MWHISDIDNQKDGLDRNGQSRQPSKLERLLRERGRYIYIYIYIYIYMARLTVCTTRQLKRG